MFKTKYFTSRTEKELKIYEAKLAKLKAERNKKPELKNKPVKIIEVCKIFIELYQKYKSCPPTVFELVDIPGSCLYENEEDALRFKVIMRGLNEENKKVKDFFLRKYLKKFDKDPNRICEFCDGYKSYKDTGICNGLVFPIKNWDKKINN